MSDINIYQSEQVNEAERAVLGGLMLETHRFDKVIQVIKETDFDIEKHQMIFQSMSELVEKNKPLDPLTISENLDNKNFLNKVGGKDYLIELATSTPSAANLDAYAEIIRERSIARKLMQTNSDIAELIRNPQGLNGSAILDKAESMIFALNDETNQDSLEIQPIRKLVPNALDRLHELSSNPGKLIGTTTGYIDLDKKLQGMHKGDLIVIAGRPGMGKSSLAMNIAENVLLDKETLGGVLIFSLEMSAESLATRLLSGMSKVNLQDVRSGKINNDDLNRLTEQSGRLQNLSLSIDESGMLSPMELRSKARRLARSEDHGLSLIVVDYLQLMQIPNSAENRVNQITEISRSLKSLAKELSVPIIALSQLNRQVEQRPNKRPVMADLRDSGAIEQDADVILFIYREKQYDKETDVGNIAEIDVGKQRNGPTGKIKLTFLEEFTRFENYSNTDIYNSNE